MKLTKIKFLLRNWGKNMSFKKETRTVRTLFLYIPHPKCHSNPQPSQKLGVTYLLNYKGVAFTIATPLWYSFQRPERFKGKQIE